jgi:hypothetical protein
VRARILLVDRLADPAHFHSTFRSVGNYPPPLINKVWRELADCGFKATIVARLSMSSRLSRQSSARNSTPPGCRRALSVVGDPEHRYRRFLLIGLRIGSGRHGVHWNASPGPCQSLAAGVSFQTGPGRAYLALTAPLAGQAGDILRGGFSSNPC